MTGDDFGSTATTCRFGVALLEPLAAAGDRAAGADAGDEHVDVAAGLLPDLLGRRAAVDLRVRRVAELVRDPGVVAPAGDALGGLDRLVHPAHRLGDLDLGAVHPQQRLALAAHALRHRQHELVALRRARRTRARCRCCPTSARRSWCGRARCGPRPRPRRSSRRRSCPSRCRPGCRPRAWRTARRRVGRDARQPDQGRVADQVGEVRRNDYAGLGGRHVKEGYLTDLDLFCVRQAACGQGVGLGQRGRLVDVRLGEQGGDRVARSSPPPAPRSAAS